MPQAPLKFWLGPIAHARGVVIGYRWGSGARDAPLTTTKGGAAMPTADFPDDATLFAALMGTPFDSVYFKDRDGRLTRVSRKMADSLGFSDPAEMVGKTDVDLFGEAFGRGTRRDEVKIMETGRPLAGVIESRQKSDGRVNWTQTTKMPLYDASGEVVGVWGITREINEMREAEVRLQHFATHDSLTGLPNRFLLADRLAQVLERSRRSKAPFAVLFMDLDRFKGVNDLLGHDVGDALLCEVALRLTESVRRSDTIARLGGDEFVVVAELLDDPSDAEGVASKIEAAVALPFVLGAAKHIVETSVSIGISFYPGNGEDADALLKAADYAMYLSKRGGGNRHSPCPPGMSECDGGMSSRL